MYISALTLIGFPLAIPLLSSIFSEMLKQYQVAFP